MRILWCHCVYIQNRTQNPNPKYAKNGTSTFAGHLGSCQRFSTKLDSYTVKHKKLFGDTTYPIGDDSKLFVDSKSLRAVGVTKNKCLCIF